MAGKKRGITWLGIGLVVCLVLLGLHLLRLDRQIRQKFEAHRWNLPSRVYAAPETLYPGLAMNAAELARKLDHRTYKKIKGPVASFGEYAESAGGLAVFLRNFSYPSEDFGGFPLKVTFADGKISFLQRLDSGETLKTVRLEPELIASIFDEKMEDRTVVAIEQIPESLVDAVVAVEDERYYRHHGVDPIAVMRAIVVDTLHLGARQGGSTLTQQLVKNFFLTPEKTLSRKLNEMMMSFLLELHYSKDEILEAYLNEIYFGQRGPVSITGVEEASRHYFGKGVSDLDVAESAMLAGIIQFPGAYSPFRNMKKSVDRRNLVLRMMRDQKKISEEDYREAVAQKVVLPPLNPKIFGAPFLVDFIQWELKENYPEEVLTSEGLRIFTTLDLEAQNIAEKAVSTHLDNLEKGRPQLKKNLEKGKSLEAVLLAVQPQTGAIRAFVGGRSFDESQFNRVRDAHRQPGSAFKPFVYAAALQTGEEEREKPWTWASTIEDEKFSVKVSGKNWTPENYDKQEHGPVTLREALEQSYNIAAVKLAIDVGLENVAKLAHDAGIDSPLKPYPSLALGAFEVTPLELIRAYTMFPNQGMRTEPIAILSVVTRDGIVLEKKGYKMTKVISPEIAYLTSKGLEGVFERGTAGGARKMGFLGLAAGKTGTTSDYKDSWFVGYTPDLLALAWVGYDDGTTTGLSGASGALPIWVDFMKRVNPPGASRSDFTATENIVLVKTTKSGKIYDKHCEEEPIEEAFLKDAVPQESCRE